MEAPRRKTDTTQIPRFSDELPVISAWKEVPSFDTEEAEGNFWEKHQLDPRLMQWLSERMEQETRE